VGAVLAPIDRSAPSGSCYGVAPRDTLERQAAKLIDPESEVISGSDSLPRGTRTSGRAIPAVDPKRPAVTPPKSRGLKLNVPSQCHSPL
jgi:hypothetical protein